MKRPTRLFDIGIRERYLHHGSINLRRSSEPITTRCLITNSYTPTPRRHINFPSGSTILIWNATCRTDHLIWTQIHSSHEHICRLVIVGSNVFVRLTATRPNSHALSVSLGPGALFMFRAYPQLAKSVPLLFHRDVGFRFPINLQARAVQGSRGGQSTKRLRDSKRMTLIFFGFKRLTLSALSAVPCPCALRSYSATTSKRLRGRVSWCV
jgi:hypothetical protein